ncbi:MAG: dodecin family protein [Ilumatobacteraceae bacterium]
MPDSDSARRDPDAVYRVVRIVATHEDGFEAAAHAGIAELARSIDDLRVARVTELDTVVEGGRVVRYRVKLEASYRIDRRRLAASGPVTVSRVLVVANASIGQHNLVDALDRRAGSATEFHVLAPVLPSGWAAAASLGDPSTGIGPTDAGFAESQEDAIRTAVQRVRSEVDRLRGLGSTATGEVIVDDPADAVLRVLERASFDEILVSTLPSAVSRWLRLDLSSRLRRRTSIPVVEISGD